MRCFGAAAVQCGEITNLPDRISAPAWAAPARPRWWASSELAPLTSPAPGLQTSNRQKLLEASSSQNPTLTYVSLVGGGASLPLLCVFAPAQRWTGERIRGGGPRALLCATHPPSSSPRKGTAFSGDADGCQPCPGGPSWPFTNQTASSQQSQALL